MFTQTRKTTYLALVSVLTVLMTVSNSFGTSSSNAPKAPALGGGGGGVVSGSGTVTPDLFTGTMSYSIPIEVPAGRKRMQPDLALTYRSDNDNGYLGVGWDLEIGAIERSARNGVSYDGDGNGYVLRTAGSAVDLVSIGNNEYRAKIEGAFLKFVKNGDGASQYWDVYDKSGVHYTYGKNKYGLADPRQYDPSNANHVFKWCLDRVEDTNGNYMTYAYTADQNQIYIDQINYTGNSSSLNPLTPTNYVKFYWESRTDAPAMYNTNFAIKTAKRLKTIDVAANGNRVRVYALTYDAVPNTSGNQYSANTSRSLLGSVQQYDKNASINTTVGDPAYGTVTGTSLPSITFSWSQPSSDWQHPLQTWTGPAPGNPINDYCLVGDYNGDGLADIACYGGSGNWTVSVSTIVNNLNGWSTAPWTGGPAPATPMSNYCMAGDFNGDGKTEIACYTSGGSWNVASSAGNNNTWTTTPWTGGPAPATPVSSYCMTGDFNGDGKTEIACYTSGSWNVASSAGNNTWTTTSWTGGPAPASTPIGNYCVTGDYNGDGKMEIACYTNYGSWSVAISQGSYWTTTTWNGPAPATPIYNYCESGDYNGDGKTDIACYTTSGNWTVALSTSATWTTATWSGGPAPSSVGSSCETGDYNGDGKTDIACYTSSGNWTVALSTGATWTTTTWSGGPAPSSASSYCEPGDYNGDGKADIACYTSGGNWSIALSTQPADLLTSIQNGIGGTTTIAYSSSTQYSNAQLPFPIRLVSSIGTNDGVASSVTSTTTYDYKDGYYYIPGRDFRGFNYVKVSGPVGPNDEQKIIETWFHQGDETGILDESITADELRALYNATNGFMKGKPYRTRISDKSGNAYTETTTIYAADADNTPYFNPPSQIDTYNCDAQNGSSCAASGAAQHIETAYTYDDYGNITREDQYGDLADSNDDRTITRSFSPNLTKWIVNKPTSVIIYSGIGTTTQISHTDYWYDGPDDCTLGSTINYQTPVKGNLTRIVRGFYDGNGGTQISSRMGYDAYGYGNLACTRDPKGNVSTINYDSTFTFPTVAQNALGQQTTTQYYAGAPADVGLYGQVKSVSTLHPYNQDYNPPLTLTEYDTFGRRTKVTKADGTWTSSSYNNFGTAGAQYVRTDTSAGLSALTYFDGLGRTTTQKKSAATGWIVTTTSYNSTGTVAQTSLPYFDGPTPTSPPTQYTYDGIGRVVHMVNPDTTSVSSCYYNGVTLTIDANNHFKRSTTNALGKLVMVEEFEGTLSGCPTDPTNLGVPAYTTTSYAYDVLGNLLTVTDNTQSNKTQMRYDSLGRKFYMSDPDMGAWSYGYDDNGNLITQKDAKGQIISFTYDTLNRVKTKTYPDNTAVTYTYDVKPDTSTTTTYSLGRLSIMGDPSGTTMYFYDIMGRTATTKKTIDGTTYTIASTYDNGGRLASLQYPDGDTIGYGYDGGGNLSQVSTGAGNSYGAWQSGMCDMWVESCPNGPGIDTCNSDSMNEYTCPSNSTVKTCNDTAWYSSNGDQDYYYYRTVSCGGNYVTYSNFNAFGEPVNVTFGNGVTTTYSYNSSNSRITSIITKTAGGSTLLNLGYYYDYAGNVTSITDSINTARSQTFEYDELNRLTQADSVTYRSDRYGEWQSGSCSNLQSPSTVCPQSMTDSCDSNTGSSYTCPSNTVKTCNDVANDYYDAGSDVEYWNYRTVSCSAPLSYIYNDIGNILSKEGINYDQYGLNAGPHAVTHTSDGKTYTYDVNGNMISDGTRTITYNFDNMPKSVLISGKTTSFVYDGNGNRVKKITPGGPTIIYIGDLYQCTVGSSCSKYIFAGGTRIALKTAAGAISYYHGDHLTSTRIVTDSSGNKIEDISYYPFGSTQADSAGLNQGMMHKYTSQELDPETGFYYYKARYYNPALGRFISADSIDPDRSDPQSLNRYSYALNNPLRYKDSTGHYANSYGSTSGYPYSSGATSGYPYGSSMSSYPYGSSMSSYPYGSSMSNYSYGSSMSGYSYGSSMSSYPYGGYGYGQPYGGSLFANPFSAVSSNLQYLNSFFAKLQFEGDLVLHNEINAVTNYTNKLRSDQYARFRHTYSAKNAEAFFSSDDFSYYSTNNLSYSSSLSATGYTQTGIYGAGLQSTVNDKLFGEYLDSFADELVATTAPSLVYIEVGLLTGNPYAAGLASWGTSVLFGQPAPLPPIPRLDCLQYLDPIINPPAAGDYWLD